MCDLCNSPENDSQGRFALIYYTSKSVYSGGTSGNISRYELIGKANVSVCDPCIEKNLLEKIELNKIMKRFSILLVSLWVLALIYILNRESAEPNLIKFFVMPGGLLILLTAGFSFGFSVEFARKSAINETLQIAASKVIPWRVAQMKTVDPIHYFVWAEKEWEKRLRTYNQKR